MRSLENRRFYTYGRIYKILIHFIFAVLLICNILIFLKPCPLIVEKDPLVYYYAYPQGDASCHIDNKWLQDLNYTQIMDLKPLDTRIFFQEISCKGGLTSRQACAVESAARSNPDWSIQVLFLGQIHEIFQNTKVFKALEAFENVNFVRVNLTSYFIGTPIESVFDENMMKYLTGKERAHKHNLANLLKYLTLYKFGGVFMEMDFIVINSFNELAKNWAGKQENELSIDALSFSNDDIGRAIANAIMLDIRTSYNPFLEDNGLSVLVRALASICSSKEVTDMSADTCQGFEFYGENHLYPVTRSAAVYSFSSRYSDTDLADTVSAYAHRLWSELTAAVKLPSHARAAILARLHCPTVYHMYGKDFGV